MESHKTGSKHFQTSSSCHASFYVLSFSNLQHFLETWPFGQSPFARCVNQWMTPHLVGGAITILKNDGVRQWGWDDIPYMKWIFFSNV